MDTAIMKRALHRMLFAIPACIRSLHRKWQVRKARIKNDVYIAPRPTEGSVNTIDDVLKIRYIHNITGGRPGARK